MKNTLQIGIKHTHTFDINDSKTVQSLLPESKEFQALPNVFATGYMVGLIEWTCIQALNPYLDWLEEQTVGTHIDVSHIAGTPPGLSVTVKVKLVKIDGRCLVFEVEANDGIDLISRGRHERYVINKNKFDLKMNNKSKEK